MWIAEHLADCADVVATNLTMDTTTSTEQRKGQVDETPLSPIEDAKAPLEKLLGQRPTQKELVDHNILKGSRCPAITVAMRATLTDDARILCCFASLSLQIPRSLPPCMQLSKSSSDVSLRYVNTAIIGHECGSLSTVRLQDKLSGALAQRPTADELVKEGILNSERRPERVCQDRH